MRVAIRCILIDTQNDLRKLAEKYQGSNLLPHFYRDVNRLVKEVDNMEVLFRDMLSKMNAEATSEERESNQEAPKSLKAFFESLSEEAQANCYHLFQRLISQIVSVTSLSIEIVNATNTLINNKIAAIFLTRLFDARREIANALV